MARRAKHLLYKHEDQSLDPQNLCKSRVQRCTSVGVVGRDRKILGAPLAGQPTKNNKLRIQ